MPASTKYPGCIGSDVLMGTREQVCDPRLAAVPALVLSQLGEWTSDLAHHDRMVAKQIFKENLQGTSPAVAQGLGSCGRQVWLGTGCLGEGESRQEAGGTGQTITAWPRRDELRSKAQLELKLQQEGQEEGVNTYPSSKGQLREMWVQRRKNLMLFASISKACSQPLAVLGHLDDSGPAEVGQKSGILLKGPLAWSLSPPGVT